ncbi:MAG TPA: hypothetical protein VJK48_02680 [Chlamydiales bacterium]|nr:hypothetical protein [Chlamydiales bacterium]
MVFIFFLLSFSMSVFGNLPSESASPFLDPENLPYSRTKMYSTGPYNKVVIYSAPRTGSSFVYNVFRYLFEEDKGLSLPHDPFHLGGKVRKTHDRKNVKALGKEGTLCIATIRNPIHASVSRYRTRKEPPQKLNDWCRSQISKQAKYLKRIEELKNEGYSVIVLKYEEIEGNFDALFSTIETQLFFTITDEDKERIRQGYSKENITKKLASLSNFQEALPLSGFHGSHISSQTYAPPEEVVHLLNVYRDKQKKVFQRYGY